LLLGGDFEKQQDIYNLRILEGGGEEKERQRERE
jgi:hypothetical protein